MSKIAQFVGLDVHKDTIAMAVAEAGSSEPPRDLGEMPHDARRLLKRLDGLVPRAARTPSCSRAAAATRCSTACKPTATR